MKKLLKIFFSLVVIVAVAALIIWLAHQRGWHWWVGVAIFFGIIGVLFSVVLLRKSLTRRKMREFVARVVEQNNFTSGVGLKSVNRIQALKNSWQEALNIIKKSNEQYITRFVMVGGNV